MNPGKAYALQSLFGPPSNPINVAHFLDATTNIELLPQETDPVAAECSVADIRDALFDTWNNPKLSGYILKQHEHAVASLYTTSTKTGKLKRKSFFSDSDQLSPDLVALQNSLDAIKLSCWKLQMDSVLFMRAPKNSDQNVLAALKSTPNVSTNPGAPLAVITISVHNRVPWGPSYVCRVSQHALISSQTLGDLIQVIPCTSNEMPDEFNDDGRVTYEHCKKPISSSGCVICIEGLAYGDGLTGIDYADKFLLQLAKSTKDVPAIKKAPTSMHDTPLSTLSLRINEPYWVLHQGNCEHFIVVDQIRLQHASDPSSGYPLTLQITPPLLDLCRACAKVPAVWSIIGDTRLGENPCLLCAFCWRNMGDSDDKKVVAIPLPSYEIGW